LPYEEKHWLEYGTDYTVMEIEDQDIGGMLTLLISLPPEAEQLVIRRVTPNTQEVDLHNGARLTAELIESVDDKLTMQIQEIAKQVVYKDDIQEIRRTLNDALEKAISSVLQWLAENDLKLAQIYEKMETHIEECDYLMDFLIKFIESRLGPLGGAFPLVIESGEYLVADNRNYLITAQNKE